MIHSGRSSITTRTHFLRNLRSNEHRYCAEALQLDWCCAFSSSVWRRSLWNSKTSTFYGRLECTYYRWEGNEIIINILLLVCVWLHEKSLPICLVDRSQTTANISAMEHTGNSISFSDLLTIELQNDLRICFYFIATSEIVSVALLFTFSPAMPSRMQSSALWVLPCGAQIWFKLRNLPMFLSKCHVHCSMFIDIVRIYE